MVRATSYKNPLERQDERLLNDVNACSTGVVPFIGIPKYSYRTSVSSSM